ncbi:uncharacterized protein PODANS_3_6060, partial [Podospora anserina S mat+]
SHGPVSGATLTLTREHGNLVIAFTAFFVTIISSRFWRILFHRYYSDVSPHDALHHQCQVTLRNSASPASGLWTLGQLAFVRCDRAKHSIIRVLPAFFSAFICAFGRALASGFSSNLATSSSHEVLLDGSNCSLFRLRESTPGSFSAAVDASVRKANTATNYAQDCYNFSNYGGCSAGSPCNPFVVPRLALSQDTNCAVSFQ